MNQVVYDQILMVRDFNATANNRLDRSGKKRINQQEGKLLKAFFELVKQEGLEDVWRKFIPEVKDFTYYLARHQLFSRIDMIWATKELGLWTKKIEILPRISSDHNLLIWFAGGGLKQYKWRLNMDLLTHQNNVTFLKKELNE